MSDTKVLHFGIYPLDREDEACFSGYKDSTATKDYWFKTLVGPVSVQVEGSWKCWGTADQDTDGDNSLHLWMYVSPRVQPNILGIVWNELDRIARESGNAALDFAILTTEDWSEVEAVLTFRGGCFQYAVKEA